MDKEMRKEFEILESRDTKEELLEKINKNFALIKENENSQNREMTEEEKLNVVAAALRGASIAYRAT